MHEILWVLFKRFQGLPTLYLLSAMKGLTKWKDMLSELAFSGRHANQSVWVLSQRYSSILKDLREQTKWVYACSIARTETVLMNAFDGK